MSTPTLADAALSAHEYAVLTSFITQVRADFGDRIAEMRLFGSRARGEGDETSDVDVAVILRDGTTKERARIIDFATDLLIDEEVDISPLVWPLDHYERLVGLERAIALEVREQGVPL